MASILSISTPSATLTFSDIDSDAAAALLLRSIRHHPSTTATASRSTHPPTPGTRRFRRYLNALLSADEGDGSSSDYYSASEVEREEGEPEVWRSEWRGEFVRVGDEFFEGRLGVSKHDRGADEGEEEKGSRLQRRVKTIERERMERRRERRERLERKQRRLAAVEKLTHTTASHPSGSTTAVGGVQDGSLAMLRAQRADVQTVHDEYVMVDEDRMDRKDDAVLDVQQEEEDELMVTNIIAGDALSYDLWRCIDVRTRQLLRHMDEFTYLHALEQLLLAFKAHTHTQPTTPFQPPTLPPSTTRFFSPLPSPLAGEVALHVPDGFLRHLLYGVLQWHVMYSAGRGSGGGSGGGRERRGGGGGGRGAMDVGVVCVRMQRGWVYHECRLERFIQQRYGRRS